jgi:broad specificity phosphatase PhoE
MRPADLVLIRHAESAWNAAGRWQGHADPPLSPAGREQAERLAAELAGLRLAAVVSSDLARALETARIVAGPHGLAPAPDPRLRELDVGRWSGLRREEILRLDPEALARFSAGDPDARAGGGESRRELSHRVHDALAEAAAAFAGRRIAVVAHLGVIRALLPETWLDNAGWIACDAPSTIAHDDLAGRPRGGA